MHFWPPFFSAIFLLQLTVFTPPGSNALLPMVFAPLVHLFHFSLPSAFVQPDSSIAALSIFCTALFICYCLGICAAIAICLQPISFVDAHVLSASFICWCPKHFHSQFEFIAAHGVCAASLNSLHRQLQCCTATFLCYCLAFHMLLPSAFAPLFLFNLLVVFCATHFIDCCPRHFHCCGPWIFMPAGFIILTFWLQSTIRRWFTAHYKFLTVCLQTFLLRYHHW